MSYLEDKAQELKKAIKGSIAVYIDAANLEQSTKEMFVIPRDVPQNLKAYLTGNLRWYVKYDILKKFFENLGPVARIAFYSAGFGTTSHNNFLAFLKKGLGFNLNTKPLKEYKDHTPEVPHRKANFDVEISIDAVLQRDDFNTFVLFSGDCDFKYLIEYLRGQGKMCIVFSMRGHVAEELPPASNYYFDIIDFRHDLLEVRPKLRPKNAKNPAF